LGLTGSAADHTLLAQKLQAESHLKSGSGWFIWIAGLSVVNTISAYSGSTWGFAAGLGMTQLVDAVAQRLGTAGLMVGLFINAMAVAFFLFLWAFARRGQKWAFVTGLVVYGLDTILTITLGLWLSLIIHALAIMGMVRGMKASSELQRLEAQRQMSTVGVAAAQIG
jgi:MFS family permease